MIVKVFANRGGGSPKASIDYLLGKDRKREGAEILKGDPELSLAIAESLEFKNTYTVGCLSFEENHIDTSTKKEVMEKFEEMIFAGLEKDQYNITWIEHHDKGRIELNYFIPNVELTTQKRLQPYYDKVDRPMVDSFKKVINHEYGFSNPDLLEKRQLSKLNSYTPKTTKELKETVAKFVADNISNGKITSRDQIVDLLKDSDYEIVRTTDKSISIKNPYSENGKNIRFSGEIYEKEFYGTIENTRGLGQSLEEARRRAEARDRESHAESYGRSKAELQSRIEYRSEQFSKSYQTKNDMEHGPNLNHSDIIDNLAKHGLFVLDNKQRERENSLGAKDSTNGIKRITERNSEPETIRRAIIEDKGVFTPSRLDMGRGRSIDFNRDSIGGGEVATERIEESRLSNSHRISEEVVNPGAELFHELLKRSRKHCQRIRERITGVINQVRELEHKVRDTITGTQTIRESSKATEPNLSETERAIEQYRQGREQSKRSERAIDLANQQINNTEHNLSRSGKSISESYRQSERINNELGATVEAVDKKIEEKSKGWSMSR